MTKTAAGAFCAALLAIGIAGLAAGDDDEREGHEGREGHRHGEGRGGNAPRGRDLAPVTDERYRSECGGCHFAFQPGLLPADAWQRLMGSLDRHFGDDATLDPGLAATLLDYLTANAADRDGGTIRSRAFAAAPIPTQRPPRITETRYFLGKHDEIPLRLVKDNPEVGSFANCQACHRGAEQGNFNEDLVAIPGAGRWED